MQLVDGVLLRFVQKQGGQYPGTESGDAMYKNRREEGVARAHPEEGLAAHYAIASFLTSLPYAARLRARGVLCTRWVADDRTPGQHPPPTSCCQSLARRL